MRFLLTFILFCSLCATSSNAQTIDRTRFARVDSMAKAVGPMEGYRLEQIVDALLAGATDAEERVRALYSWTAYHITFDTRAYHHPKQQNNTASYVLNTRKATPEGYASFFKALCEMARIKCMVIRGLAKYRPENIGKITDKNQHAWNAVYVNNEWHLVDVTWAAGYTDKRVRKFTRSFSGGWFMPDKELFALSHYPKKREHQGLDSPFHRGAFSVSPIVGPSAIINEVYPMVMRGKIRGRADTSQKVAFELLNPELVQSVSVGYKYRDRAPVPYSIEDNMLYVDIPFVKQGEYPVNIYINEVLAYIYNATVREPYRKPKPRPAPARKAVPVKRSTSRSSG